MPATLLKIAKIHMDKGHEADSEKYVRILKTRFPDSVEAKLVDAW